MAQELMYQSGGTLYLDEAFEAQPSAATITIVTLSNTALSTLDATFSDIEAETCDLDDLVLTLPASNEQARVLSPTDTAGTVPVLTAPGYKLLIERGGRKYYTQVNEYDLTAGDVTSLRLDSPVPFAIKVGDSAKGLRVSYTVDWSTVTSTFTGQVKATWSITVSGKVKKITKIYDVVKQTLDNPASWVDVLAMRPDADTQLAHIADKQGLVERAWETVKQDLYTMGIRHNLVVQDGSTTLRDAVVMQCLYNLSTHSNLPVPLAYSGQGEAYLDRLNRDKERFLSLLQMPVDENENEIIEAPEKDRNRRTVFFRSSYNHRQKS